MIELTPTNRQFAADMLNIGIATDGQALVNRAFNEFARAYLPSEVYEQRMTEFWKRSQPNIDAKLRNDIE